MADTMPAGFYEQTAPDTFVATTATQSPWDRRLQHGSPPTTLLAHAMQTNHPRDDVRIARITAEFLGPIPIGTMHVTTRVVRPGKRIELIEGAIACDGREVVLARVWRIAVQAAGAIPAATTAPDVPPPMTDEIAKQPAWLDAFGYGEAFEWRFAYGFEGMGPAAAWTRPRIPLIAGGELAPLDRALLIVDSANGISGELPMMQWMFVPPTLSVALERYPRGEWTLLEARTTLADDGIGTTVGRLADAEGYFATATQALLVERR
jgi:hypothetical protein